MSDHLPILLLHGFTGSSAEWDDLLPSLRPHHQVIAVDLPGHGESASHPLSASVPQCLSAPQCAMEPCVADLLATLDSQGINRCVVLGYSMGGRVALHLALAAPERVAALILESASPGLADPDERAARAAADEALAAQILSQGIAWFADYWQSIPLFASQTTLPAEVRAALHARRLRCDPAGLACSLRGMGTGQQASLWPHLPDLKMPTLLVTGDLDLKFVAINRQMAAQMPNAQHQSLPDAGHTVHLEQPQAFAQLVVGFLAERERLGDLAGAYASSFDGQHQPCVALPQHVKE